jgi:2',3'-cyclic-nucleotide 2'-phosphodiesterase/3'-nucleotidase/5'-nucleotidase
MKSSLFSSLSNYRAFTRQSRVQTRRKRPVLASEPLESRQMLSITLTPIGRYATGIFDQGAAEAVNYNARTERIFIGNQAAFTPGNPNSSYVPECDGDPGNPDATPPIPPTPAEPCAFGRIDVVDASDPTDLGPNKKLFSIDVSQYGAPTSIASKGKVIAVAIPNGSDASKPGVVAFFDAKARRPERPIKVVEVGALPDMVAFSPDGDKVLTANEGQPCDLAVPEDCYEDDPEGSVSIIDISRGLRRAKEERVTFTKFNHRTSQLRAEGVMVLPDRPAAQSIEPEYLTIHPNSKVAWVTLQENNAIAEIDLKDGKVSWIRGLGTKDHSLAANAFDPSDRDGPGAPGPVGAINIGAWPVRGMYQPDGIAAFATDRGLFLATANEGDIFIGDDARVSTLDLDDARFPNEAALKTNSQLGRLTVSRGFGDTDGDGDIDKLLSYGARSFTIWNDDGRIVWDSGDDFEQVTAAAYPNNFNASNNNNNLDARSPAKGPEPTTVAVAKIGGRSYAIVTVERTGGLMVYDVTRPTSPTFVQYVNTRDFSINPTNPAGAGTATDLHPENLTVVSAEDSPTGKPLVVVSYQVSGSAVVFEINRTPHAASSLVVHAAAPTGIEEAERAETERQPARRATSVVQSPTRRLAATDRALATQSNGSRSTLYASRSARPTVESTLDMLSQDLTRSLSR